MSVDLTNALTGPHLAWSVYTFIAADGTVLYVGMTSRGSGRLAQHTARPWWQATEEIRLEHFETEHEAREYEAYRIRVYRPLFNTAQRPAGIPHQVNTRQALGRRTMELEGLLWERQNA